MKQEPPWGEAMSVDGTKPTLRFNSAMSTNDPKEGRRLKSILR